MFGRRFPCVLAIALILSTPAGARCTDELCDRLFLINEFRAHKPPTP